MEVSVVVPTFNERDNLWKVLSEIEYGFEDADVDYEVVVVDDKSPDGTWELAHELARRDSRIKVVVRDSERGLASAILRGIRESSNDIVVVMDTDLSHDSVILPKLVGSLRKYDIAVGSRFVEGGRMNAPLSRVVGSKLINAFIRVILRSKLKDNTGGFLSLNKKCLSGMDLEWIFRGYGDYCIRLLNLAQQKRLKIREIGYTHNYRTKGKSKTPLIYMGILYLIEVLNIFKKNLGKGKTPSTKDEQEYFNSVSKRWDKTNPRQEYAYRMRLKLILSSVGNVPPESMVLDLGCATGRYSIELARAGFSVVSVDYSYGMVKVLKARLTDRNCPCSVFPVVADALNLPFKGTSFKAVSFIDVLLNLPDEVGRREALGEINRILTGGGCLLLDVPNHLSTRGFAICLLHVFRSREVSPIIHLFSAREVRDIVGGAGFTERGFWGVNLIPQLCPKMFIPAVERIESLFAKSFPVKYLCGDFFLVLAKEGDEPVP